MVVSEKLIDWYLINKRDLPWRKTRDPYLIWVSEIILQQTRVVQGIDYYYRFIMRFPTIDSLANSSEEDVLLVWRGLGYYSRARNMYYTAKQIQTEYNSLFPRNYDNLIKLKGIGEYTASAILSFAFKKPFPVVDGNVSRVISRIYGVFLPINSSEGQSKIGKYAKELLNVNNPDIHNQAIMEFGAIQCIPLKPDCELCPFHSICLAFKNGSVNVLPLKNKKHKIKSRFFNYFFIHDNEYLFFRKRKAKDIWQHLYEFPLIESNSELSFENIIENADFIKITKNMNYKLIHTSEIYVHQLTHQKIYAKFYDLELKILNLSNIIDEEYILIPYKSIKEYAYPVLIEKYLKSKKILGKKD